MKNKYPRVRSIRLTDELTERIRNIGNGDFSAGLNEAIELLLEKYKAVAK